MSERIEAHRGGRWWRVLLFATCAALVFARTPELLLSPRFFAEEGKYFRFAYEVGFPRSLVVMHWPVGYFNLVPNLACSLGVLLPLEFAPACATYLSFLVQLIPFAILAFGRGSFVASPVRRVTASLALLFLPTMMVQAWMASLHAQVHLGIAALLILLDDEARGTLRRWGYRAILALGGLTGVYVVFLWPVFVYRAFAQRVRDAWIEAAVVTGTLVVQGGFWIASIQFGASDPRRAHGELSETIALWATSHIALPLTGIRVQALAKSLPLPALYLFLVAFLALAAFVLWDRTERRLRWRDPRCFTLLAYFCVAACVSFTAYDGRPVGRYAIVPSVAVALFVIQCIDFRARRILSAALLVMLALACVRASSRDYWEGSRCQGHEEHRWRDEVARFRADPTREIAICPRGKTIRLERRGD